MPYNWHTSHSARHETLGANTADSTGVAVTSGSGAKGSYVDIGGTTSFAYEMMYLYAIISSAAANFVCDLAINVGGNRGIIAADLRLPFIREAGHAPVAIPLPLHVAAGAQLSARVQASTGTPTCDLVIIGSSTGLMGCPGFSECIALFAHSSAAGVTLDAGGSSNTEPGWTQITASSAKRIAAIMAVISSTDTSVVANNFLMDISFGGAGSEQTIISDAPFNKTGSPDHPHPVVHGPWAVDVAASSRFAGRIRGSTITAGDRAIDIGLYGFVP